MSKSSSKIIKVKLSTVICGKFDHKKADFWTKQKNEGKHANIAEENHSFEKNVINTV